MSERAHLLTVEKTKDLIEVSGKASLGIVAFCYVIGLCVVSIYLNNYGIHSLSLLRVNYITAGVWAILPILISLLTVFAVVGVFRSLRLSKTFVRAAALLSIKTKPSTTGKPTWPMLSNWFLFVPLIILVSLLLGIELSGKWLWALLTGALVVLSLLPLFHIVKNPAVPGTLTRSVHIGSILIMAILLLFLHVLVFANRVYGTIPSHIGGGGAKKVQVVFDEGALPNLFMESGVNSEETQGQSKDVLLLFVTDEEFIFLVKDSNLKEVPIGIRRDKVKVILYK
ncbi:MAG TPA: hypothetical protein VJM50_02505 [Pyrinomonadaceae bacterium]|nr:hypothetical protein [Pyrinomonadaceae bacterium]